MEAHCIHKRKKNGHLIELLETGNVPHAHPAIPILLKILLKHKLEELAIFDFTVIVPYMITCDK